ncbi:UbiA prenyltransferase [Colletotrichum chrysophilum]|uniref:UbiA prenyltransferase n=1 Tax=Colletotrichum chrysophilum TaxID=1836956 RepID=A0AAD8ZYN8_9PEZI|nr:UbiA prenyltransferase [Colletotrichum chrysophilum]
MSFSALWFWLAAFDFLTIIIRSRYQLRWNRSSFRIWGYRERHFNLQDQDATSGDSKAGSANDTRPMGPSNVLRDGVGEENERSIETRKEKSDYFLNKPTERLGASSTWGPSSGSTNDTSRVAVEAVAKACAWTSSAVICNFASPGDEHSGCMGTWDGSGSNSQLRCDAEIPCPCPSDISTAKFYGATIVYGVAACSIYHLNRGDRHQDTFLSAGITLTWVAATFCGHEAMVSLLRILPGTILLILSASAAIHVIARRRQPLQV